MPWWVVHIVLQVTLRPERPEGFWPVSVTGWVTLASSSIALGIVIWRANNKPVLDKLAMLEQRFDTEVKRIEKRLDDEEKHRDKDTSSFLKQVDDRINGFGRRVDETRIDLNRVELAVEEQARSMVESMSDRRQINQRIAELSTTVGTLVQQLPALEIRINQALSHQTREILREFSNIVVESTKKRGNQ